MASIDGMVLKFRCNHCHRNFKVEMNIKERAKMYSFWIDTVGYIPGT